MPTMKTIAVSLVMLMASCLGSLSCATAGSTTQPRVQWPALASCLQVTADEVFQSVQSVLLSDGSDQSTLSDRAVTQLEDLAVTHGASTIACLIDRAATALNPPTARTALMAQPAATHASDLRQAAATRGRNFLARVGTQVSQGEP